MLNYWTIGTLNVCLGLGLQGYFHHSKKFQEEEKSKM